MEKIREVVGYEVINIEDQEMEVVAVERHSAEPVEGKVTEISKFGFKMEFDSHEYSWMEMSIEDLCCLLDYLIER